MLNVEKNIYEGPMRIGFGRKEHHDALRQLFGCESFWTPKQVDLARIEGLPHPLREGDGDVAVMIQPKHFEPINIRWLSTTKCEFEVPGHDPRRLLTKEDREQFRELRLNAKKHGVEITDGRGAKPQYEITQEHIDAAIADWHAGEQRADKWVPVYTLKEIEERMYLRSGIEVKSHWVRDQVSKRFKTATRKPPDA